MNPLRPRPKPSCWPGKNSAPCCRPSGGCPTGSVRFLSCALPARTRSRDRPGDGHQPEHGQVVRTPGAGGARADPGGRPMISLESRIYADAEAVAAEITPADIPPLRLPAARDRRSRSNGHGHPGTRFWLAPLAAAASVVAITTTMIIAGQVNGGSRAPMGHVHPATGGRVHVPRSEE